MTTFLDAEKCWQAVLQRDENGHGAFFYGVLSTRIFCRPSCPSRRPRREGVRFFNSAADAVASGFRACKRCKPEHDSGAQNERIHKACRLIEANLDAPLSLETLGREVQLSASHLQRSFKKIIGVSPRQYADAQRLKHWKSHVSGGEKITAALYDSGYGSTRGLYERAASHLGMTPATYRKGGAGVLIAFDIAPTNLGFLLVAKTAVGMCAISLGDDAQSLEANLKSEFFAAQIERDAAKLKSVFQAIAPLLQGRAAHFDLPFDVRATAFQNRVWQELRAIPCGETRTYSQLAQKIGQPTASRAVARACATNSLAVVIPCHRVVRRSGELSGYRWGVARKKALLELERKSAQTNEP